MRRKRRSKNKRFKAEERNRKLQEIRNLKNKIAEYEKKISEQKIENFKEFHVRNLKVFAGTCNLILPFVVVGGLATGVFKFCNGGFPFYRDDITKYNRYELEYDTLNEINANIEYVRNEWWSDTLPSDSLTMYTPWEEENGSYVRYKRTYKLPEEEDYFSELYDAIFKKDYNYIIKHYNVAKEEKEVSSELFTDFNDYIIEAKLYKIDSDDFIKFPESDCKNKIITIIEIIITLGLGGIITHVRDFDYKEYLEDVNEDYKSNKKELSLLEQEMSETKKKLLVLCGNTGGCVNGK